MQREAFEPSNCNITDVSHTNESFQLQIYMIACSVSVHQVVNMYNICLHGMAFPKCCPSYVNYKIIFIYFSASFFIDIYHCWLRCMLHAQRLPSVNCLRSERTTHRWLIWWDTMLISKCANDKDENEWPNVIIACFIWLLLSIFFVSVWFLVSSRSVRKNQREIERVLFWNLLVITMRVFFFVG